MPRGQEAAYQKFRPGILQILDPGYCLSRKLRLPDLKLDYQIIPMGRRRTMKI